MPSQPVKLQSKNSTHSRAWPPFLTEAAINYYERHLGDYARDTSHLTITEHGAYTLLLDRYYATERPIPADQVHRLARARSPDEIKAVDDVLAEFFTFSDGLWRHSRCDAEIVKKEAKTKAARENGKTGGRPKKQAFGYENETQQKPNGLSLGYENETQQKPMEKLTRHQTPDTSNTSPIGDGLTKPSFAIDEPLIDNCPHQQIIASYHDKLPSAIRVREWTPARAQALRARWREKPQRQNLEWWGRFFDYIAGSDFLMGRTNSNGRKPFEIDLEWICQSKNFVKIIEGKFHEAKEVEA